MPFSPMRQARSPEATVQETSVSTRRSGKDLETPSRVRWSAPPRADATGVRARRRSDDRPEERRSAEGKEWGWVMRGVLVCTGRVPPGDASGAGGAGLNASWIEA
ncbi:hypothetical protein ACFFX0_16475 [Citricoccus parietis]|uniref:Uncharacterized protein n=1 Tax=Citricoccus parietis TaxID=592307 RepID=A0ABV5G194_9MICC